jgi:hypothetical protein
LCQIQNKDKIIIGSKYHGKEVILLKSSISSSLFSKFSSGYQSYSRDQKAFVYVDPEGNVKLVTDVVKDNGCDDGIFAVSMAEDGWMEFLALK